MWCLLPLLCGLWWLRCWIEMVFFFLPIAGLLSHCLFAACVQLNGQSFRRVCMHCPRCPFPVWKVLSCTRCVPSIWIECMCSANPIQTPPPCHANPPHSLDTSFLLLLRRCVCERSDFQLNSQDVFAPFWCPVEPSTPAQSLRTHPHPLNTIAA